ncbi:MAG: maleylpyruvate isomerase family mycothiol-dependent enzyme [Actinoallomurus sp.]
MTGKTPPSTLLLRSPGTCDLDPEHLLDAFGRQRQRFVAILAEFGPDDWAAPTRCAEWSAHDVVRHLCDATPALAAGADDRMLDTAAGFNPRKTPREWLAASAGEPPAATLARFVAKTGEALTLAHDRLARGETFGVGLPFGSADWTVRTLHVFWDSWIHERDVLLARGAEHPTDGDATGYAAAYGMFLAGAVAAMAGDRVGQSLTLDGDGGGVFDLDISGTVTLTVSRVPVTGQPAGGRPAARVADALAGRAQTPDVLGDLPDGTRAALTRLADFFDRPSRRARHELAAER